MRARCSVFIATSLDGFIARADGGIDWLKTVERPDEDYGYKRFADSIDALVIGRKTYETASQLDPWPFAGKRCVVLTHQSLRPKHGEEFASGDLAEIVDRLTREGVKRIYVDGGDVIRQFLAASLITDVTLSLVPILLGEGAPLFGKLGRDVHLDLVGSKSFASGLVQLKYTVHAIPPPR
jgi:dihydrofolate reductase